MRRLYLVNTLMSVIRDKKAKEVVLFDTRLKNAYYDYVIICTSRNIKNSEAIVDAVEETILQNKKAKGIKNIEGKGGSPWMVVDAKNIIVHVFTEEERARIDIDKLLTDMNYRHYTN